MSDRNTQLMKEMGSKTGRYDPEPPDQWKWNLENGTPAERMLAWVKSKTVAFGHGTPYATDEHSKPLYIEHAAADLGWAFHTTQNVATALVEQGRIRLDRKGKRIWLCAEVAAREGRKLGEVGENLSSVQRIFPTYVTDFIENLPAHKKDAAIRKYSEYWEWHLGLLSNAVAAARAISAPYEDITLREIGMDKKRLPHRREPAPGAVQLQLLEVPSFVQNNGHASEPVVYKPVNGSVHSENGERTNGASLLSSDSDSDRDSSSSETVVHRGRATTTHPSPPKTEKPETQPLTEELGFDAEAGRELIAKCRKRDPGITVAQIVHLGRLKIDQVREKLRAGEIKNPVGFLLKAIPNMVSPPRTHAAGAD